MYLQYAQALINRNNSITRTMYKDSPVVLAWELINEARVPQDMSGDTLQARLQRLFRVCVRWITF